MKENGDCNSKFDLIIEGEVPLSKADSVNNLKKALNEGTLKVVSPASFRIEIEVKPLIGEQFYPITEVIDIYTQDEKKIEAKPGQVLLIDFWGTKCVPC